MNIVMQYGNNETEISSQEWDVAFIGQVNDQREKVAKQFIENNSLLTWEIKYNANSYNLEIDGNLIAVDLLNDYLERYELKDKKIVIDATSMGVADFLVLIQSLYDINNISFDVLYLEPQSYRISNNSFIEKRNFELSDGVGGYIGIPGQSLSFERTDRAVFFCGYEAERLDRAFEELDIIGKNTQLIFGIPPFHAGWDINSFSNHINVIEKQSINQQFYYCGASNPLAICDKLDIIYDSLAENEKLFIIPIGTKPMAIGACIYKVAKNDKYKLSILYDHPIRKEGRSTDISRWNLYNIVL